MSCSACSASRRRTVDAFMLGYRAGFRMAASHALYAAGYVATQPTFCLEHDKMITEAHVAELKEILPVNVAPPNEGGAT